MCGIIGCVGNGNVASVILGGLKRVEYRGYDSAGIAVLYDNEIVVKKGVGRIEEIEREKRLSSLLGSVGLGHTRWATHGGVSEKNAHPHTSCANEIAIVHNGIINNYLRLKKKLISLGHKFKSETDSEVIAHLIEEEYKNTKDPIRATIRSVKKLRGQYAIAVLFKDMPNRIIGARKDAPLLIGLGKGESFIASDVLAFIEYTDKAIFLDNFEVAEIRDNGVRIFRLNGREVRRSPVQVAWELADVSKLDYAHYTLKEIHEQDRAIINALYQNDERVSEFVKSMRNARSIFITGAGTSYHAGLIMKYRLAKDARMKSDTVLAGEFKSIIDFVDDGSVLIAFSQSGETADVLEAIRDAKRRGAKILSIVNAAGSSLARESDTMLLLNCGPEIGVAATKSFTAQIMISNIVVDRLVGRKRSYRHEELSKMIKDALRTEKEIERIASIYKDKNDFYFIARGLHYPIALEGALKLKELSYIHAEGMPASELKHGTLALISNGTPVVVINPSGHVYDDTLSNAEEIRARGADVIGISDRESDIYTHLIKIPRAEENLMPILEVIPLQFLAYYTAVYRKNDPDYPRNLAKSVTVK